MRPNLRDQQLLVLPHLQAWDGVHLTLTHRGTAHPNPTPQGKQQRRYAPASAEVPTVAPLPCRADWLSGRKAEMHLQRRTAGLIESAIPRKS